MFYLYRTVLALHIISVISWMAGILYLIRLFVYHANETEQVVKDRFATMERRASLIILIPAMVASLIFGVALLILNPTLLSMPWMHLKLTLVILLMGISHLAGKWRKELSRGQCPHSPKFFRILNEIPTLLMVLIVFLVILRPLS